jgi:hypothetical protein
MLNKRGRVVGVALIVGRRLVAVSLANLTVKRSGRGLSLVALAAVALLLALTAAAVMLARARRRRQRHARRKAMAHASGLDETIPPLQVSLRPRYYDPDPDVRLNRPGEPDDESPAPAEDTEDTWS